MGLIIPYSEDDGMHLHNYKYSPLLISIEGHTFGPKLVVSSLTGPASQRCVAIDGTIVRCGRSGGCGRCGRRSTRGARSISDDARVETRGLAVPIARLG